MKISQEEHNLYVTELLIKNPELIEDKVWRMNNLYWIITKKQDESTCLFRMNRAQKHFFDNYLNIPNPYHRHIILKSRQLGFTTFIDIFILDEILFNINKRGIIIAHQKEDAKEFFDTKIDFAIQNMATEVKEGFFKIKKSSSNKFQIILDYGPNKGATSTITVALSGRGGTFNYVHISEFAKMCVKYPERAKEVETGTFPAVPSNGFIFIESTGEGIAGRFYEIFQQNWLKRKKITPELSKATFLPHFYNWQYDDIELEQIKNIIPVNEMDIGEIDWEEYQKENNLNEREITYYYTKWQQLGGAQSVDSYAKLRQEYPTTAQEAFVSSGMSYFPNAKVAMLAEKVIKGKRGDLVKSMMGEVTFQEVTNGNLEIFKMPEKGVKYIIGGDTSEGLAWGDAQVLYVINHQTQECDALYSSQLAPDDFSNDAYNVGKYYNWALMGIESNKDGLWVNDALEKMGYINLYYRKSFDDITQKVTKFFGWKTTSATRSYSLTALKTIFLKKDTGFPLQLLIEMMTFVRNEKGKPEALAGKNDDIVMASSIGYAILQEQQKYEVTNTNPNGYSMMQSIFNEDNLH